MKAIIMAGGFGTRLRPLTINVPKPMVPVCNFPMMEHVVSLLARHGITQISSLLYFQADKIRDHFKDGSPFGVSMDYVQPDDDFGTA
ncbi:MAG: NDP-sugar synthase, partial [candidate division Zixibacteria bacterium]|nr:NDP-sugar synthase [candidate division Zixibacteria bacterium]